MTSCNTKHRIWVGPDHDQKIFNYKYGEHKRQRMDIFLPSDYPNANPAIVLLHGGGWKYGRKESMIHIQKFLHKNKFATINLTYRLSKKGITYKDQLSDIELALQTFNQLVQNKRIPTPEYILLGESAGAHLSLLYGYQNPTKIKSIISLSGPTDFYSEKFLSTFYSKYASPTISNMIGYKFERKLLSTEYKKASPLYNISNVPTLLFQGGRDFLVHKSQAFSLDSALTTKNIEHRFIYMEKAGHTPRIFSPKKRDSIIYPEILEWIKK